MRKYLNLSFYAAVVVSIAVLYVLHFRSQSNRLVYVNSVKLLNGYQAMADARKDYEDKTKTWQANADTLMAEIQASFKKYESEMARMSAKEREQARQLIETKKQQLAQYQQSIEEKAHQQDLQLTQKVVDRANAFLERYGKEHDYQIILAANQTGNIIYAKDGLDITDQVLAVLNKEYTGK